MWRLLLVISALAFLLTNRTVGGVVLKPRKVVLITGCSSGIGLSTAQHLLQHSPYKIWATLRDPSQLHLPLDSIQNFDQDRLRIESLDVTSRSSIEGLVGKIMQEDGSIDVLVNNAGYALAGAIEMIDVDEAKDLFDVNVWGVVRMVQAVLPIMRKKGSGYIINISSTSGLRGIPCMDVYTGSKFALEGITDSMRYSLAPFNISVTNINAGPIKTKFSDKVQNAAGQGKRQISDDSSDYLKMITAGMVAGLRQRAESTDAQQPEEIGDLILKLIQMKSSARRITDIPFNIGSNLESQSLLEQIRKIPTGWGGVYNDILQVMPSAERFLYGKEDREFAPSLNLEGVCNITIAMASIWKRTLSGDFLKRANAGNVGKTMLGQIGIEFTNFGSDWLEATMPVDHRTKQPFGILHGGASVALAETLGSYASYLAIEEDKKMVVGVDISATHLRSVRSGSVTGRATPVKLGKRLHVWDVRIHETGKEDMGPTCISRLTVMITDAR